MLAQHLPGLLAACLLSAVVVTVAGVVVLRLVRSRSMATSVAVVAGVSALCVAAAAGVGGAAMFLSRPELDVVLVIAAVSGVAGLAAALVLARSMVAGSQALVASAREVGTGSSFSAPDVPTAELAELAAELSTANERLSAARDRAAALEQSRRELVAWVSHDLRTPLAGLRAMAEALEDGVVDDAETVQRYHGRMLIETDRLTGLVDDLFELSRIHAGSLRLSLQQVALADLVSDALASADPLARAKGVRLQGRAPDGLPVRVDVPELGRVLRNLLANAIRHTPSDGAVEVVGAVEGGCAYVTVSDACGGIPAADLPRVFDVAFRGTAARTPEPDGGAGLGLAISRGIVQAHSGEIDVANVGAGCRFVVRLPLAAGGG
ncbi:MAG: sensor histidine kinase [Mycobacteriales bacterium]